MKRPMLLLVPLFVPLFSLVVGAAADGATPEWSIQDLMARLASVRQVEAQFTERKTLAILREPLVSTGVLRYRAPDYLQKQVLEPRPQSYEVEAGRLFIEEPGEGRKQIDLDRYPPLRAVVESIRATMAGDLGTLERWFSLALSGSPAGWTLRLEPLDEELARHVKSILIGGREDRVLAVDTLETGGDRSEMTISPAAE